MPACRWNPLLLLLARLSRASAAAIRTSRRWPQRSSIRFASKRFPPAPLAHATTPLRSSRTSSEISNGHEPWPPLARSSPRSTATPNCASASENASWTATSHALPSTVRRDQLRRAPGRARRPGRQQHADRVLLRSLSQRRSDTARLGRVRPQRHLASRRQQDVMTRLAPRWTRSRLG